MPLLSFATTTKSLSKLLMMNPFADAFHLLFNTIGFRINHEGIASLSSRPAFMNAPFRCRAFLWFGGWRLTRLRPALDHNINGVFESLPSVGIKL